MSSTKATCGPDTRSSDAASHTHDRIPATPDRHAPQSVMMARYLANDHNDPINARMLRACQATVPGPAAVSLGRTPATTQRDGTVVRNDAGV
ncbi:hypothetical protein PCL_06391 [Purpureocillium lilacinum]|uniref:Uncharacterized protein n=1 Tax=Purpureocillium lilacinum TaxID=33203 RepID=A0A2U3EML1_PURLI|nr:hypothetical protein PCL_06391 [Purpureocillium lilacinum]